MPVAARTMEAPAAVVAPFVPPLVRERIARRATPPHQPRASPQAGAVLLVDLANFTTLTERAQDGDAGGLEALQTVLRDYFGQVVDTVASHGGAVVSFAGDAAVAFWAAGSPDGTDGLAEATWRAAGCARGLGACLQDLPLPDGVALGQRVTIGAGTVVELTVGGTDGRWESVLVGEPLEQVRRHSHDGAPGEIVLSARAWSLLGDAASGQMLAGRGWRLDTLAGEDAGAPLPRTVRPRNEWTAPGADRALRAFVPRPLLAMLDGGLREWATERRRVTVLFVHLGDFSTVERVDQPVEGGGLPALDQLNERLEAAQAAVFRQGGAVLQVCGDDKGVALVAVFGLATASHDDDALRGIRAALELGGGRLGPDLKCGIATGLGFTGFRGGGDRREYALVGDVMNTAARLMQAAPGSVLCDDATRRATMARVSYEPRPPLTLKGKVAAVPVYAPGRVRKPAPRAQLPLLGREREFERLRSYLGALERGEASPLVLVQGEPGIGKTRLLDALLERSASADVRAFRASGDPIEQGSAWAAARPLVERILAVDELDAASARDRVRTLLEEEGHAGRAHLLTGLLPVDPSEPTEGAQLSGEARAELAMELVLDLLQRQLRDRAVLILADDVQWFDEVSLSLLLGLHGRRERTLVVAASRPVSPSSRGLARTALDRLLEICDHLPVAALDSTASLELAARRLEVDGLSTEVAALLRERTEGNPLFIEEVLRTLVESGAVRTDGGKCVLVPDRRVEIPDSVHGMISARIDALPPHARLAVKIASVFSGPFSAQELDAAYPLDEPRGELGDLLQQAVQAEILVATADRLRFRHRIIRDVAYGLLPHDQRTGLHRTVAEWIERHRDPQESEQEARLAHHWEAAGKPQRAAEYLDRAGTRALREGHFHPARDLLQRALELGAAERLEPLEALRLHRRLAEAVHFAGDVAASRAPLEAVAAMAGAPVPSSPVGLAAGILLELLRQVSHRIFGVRRASGPAEEILKEAARAVYLLGPVAYLAGDAARTVYIGLRGTNLAERARPTGTLARTYSILLYLSGLVGLHSVSERYRQRSIQAAEDAGDPAALGEILYNASVYDHGAADNPRAEALLVRAHEVQRAHGEHRAARLSSAVSCTVALSRGQVETAWNRRRELLEEARREGDLFSIANALSVLGFLAGQSGRYADALGMLEECIDVSDRIDHGICGHMARGFLAEVHLLAGDSARAIDAARVARATTAAAPAAYVIDGDIALSRVWQALWRQGVSGAAEAARQATSAIRANVRLFPVGQAVLDRARGTDAWLAGRSRAARTHWQRSLDRSIHDELPLETLLTHVELAAALPPQEGATHREAVDRLLAETGFPGHAIRLRLDGRG